MRRRFNLSHKDGRSTSFASGDLTGARLSGLFWEVDFQDADLQGASFQGASLVNVHLHGARNVHPEALTLAKRLRGTFMPVGMPTTRPDGRYDGRFDLPGDIEDARSVGVDANDPAAIDRFFSGAQV